MWTVWIKDQTARSVQSDLDLHCPLKFLSKDRVNSTHIYHSIKMIHTDATELDISFLIPTHAHLTLFLVNWKLVI